MSYSGHSRNVVAPQRSPLNLTYGAKTAAEAPIAL